MDIEEIVTQILSTWRRHDEILLALKQSGLRLDDEVAVQGVWGKWIYGK